MFRRPRSRWLAGTLVWLALCLVAAPVFSAEAEYEDRPAGASVEDLGSPLSRAVAERERMHTLFPALKRMLQKYPNFVADSELVLNFRTFAMTLKDPDGEEAYAWTLGGKFSGRTGWWKESLQLGAGLYTSFPIVADDPDARTDLLRPGEKGFIVAGEAFVRGRWRGAEATLGRHELDLPYVNRNDGRMAPNSFQGVTAKGVARGVPWVNRIDWVAGYLDAMRPRNQNDFQPMSERAGAKGSNKGMVLMGIQFRPLPDLQIGAYDYYVLDTFNTIYGSADYLWKLSADWGLRFQAQYTGQKSVGSELIGAIDTWGASARVAASWRGATVWLATSKTSEEGSILTPYGSYAGYASLMQSNFDRAGERAWNLGMSYAPKILPEFSGFVQYGQGDGGTDLERGLLGSSEREIDLTLDWEVKDGRWRGLWLRVRGSMLDRDGGSSRAWEGRLIVNYTLPVL